MIKSIACFTVLMWGAAALLYMGQHSVAIMALSGVLVLAALDLCQPTARRDRQQPGSRAMTDQDEKR